MPNPAPTGLEYIYYRLFMWLEHWHIFALENGRVVFTGQGYIALIRFILIILSIIFSIGVINLLHKFFQLRKQEALALMEALVKNQPTEHKKNAQWEKIQTWLISQNPSDWVQAIIEADKMLDELLNLLGYGGSSLGDKLIAVEVGQIKNLDEAWEAHKFRNRIAHEKNFQVTEHDVKKIIYLYEKVFREFDYV